ncbi:hypothetical protein [Flavobacterium sp.]|uniref:hypothetical protein n=1 Tax=Flavobacterium sp. TaxID=239 RepID=UPI0039E6FC39
MIHYIAKLDWGEIISKSFESIQELYFYLTFMLPKEIFEKVQNMNSSVVCYYFGYLVINILEFLIPPIKLAKVAKVAKLDRVAVFFEEVSAVGQKASKAAKKTASEMVDLFFASLKKMEELFESGTESVRKAIDDMVQKIVKWLEETFGIGRKSGSPQYAALRKKYGKLVAKGKAKIKKDFDIDIQKILDEVESEAVLKEAIEKYKAYKAKKIGKKLSEKVYIKRYIQLVKNKKVGKLAEAKIIKHLKGKIERPVEGITLTSIGPDGEIIYDLRYPDNFLNGLMREVKSGPITMNYMKQIDLDIEILKAEIKYKGFSTKKIEWHAFNGIEEIVLDQIQAKLKANGIPLKKFQVILY